MSLNQKANCISHFTYYEEYFRILLEKKQKKKTKNQYKHKIQPRVNPNSVCLRFEYCLIKTTIHYLLAKHHGEECLSRE